MSLLNELVSEFVESVEMGFFLKKLCVLCDLRGDFFGWSFQ